MNEQKRKRREWVKTAAIVFLSVMLVLTFFSNTIMNYSLPEVAAQYIQSGTITAQIRGTGVVESGDPYNVRVGSTRKVESIEVNVGDTVQKGDVLMYLSYDDTEALQNARAELEAAELAFELALLTGDLDTSVIQSAGSSLSLNAYKNQILSLKNEIALAESEYNAAKNKVDELTLWDSALSTQLSITQSSSIDVQNEQAALDKAKKAMDDAKKVKDDAQNEVDVLAGKIKYEQSISSGDAVLDALNKKKDAANQKLILAENEYNKAEYEYNKAKDALDAKRAAVVTNLSNQQTQTKLDLFHAQNEMDAKKEILTEKQNALNDYINNTRASIDLSTKYQSVTDAKEKISALEAQMTASEVKAPISGTITAIHVQSGLDTPTDGIVVNMKPEGEGYTMSFSVTNEQARKVNVGEQASLVNSWRYDDLTVTLTKIMPDQSNPGQNKLLVFEVEGESVFEGQNLNVSVGQKSSNYDMLVPNSAIREDNNGKFVLIVESKSSPLGNRYKAVRMDVEVIASDDTKSAISGALYGYEFVITTSTKPVEAGQYIRLSEN